MIWYILIYLLIGVFCCFCDCKGSIERNSNFELTIGRALVSIIGWIFIFGWAILGQKLLTTVIWRKQ